ncbi:MAG: hypothetical protein H6R45_36 [Proteobacteria bacterium]|nr:hypothetical protein [Pseudomonadota bacterium]
MSIFRKVSPTGAVRDFAQVWTGNPYRWRVLAVAMLGTLGMMAIFIPKSELVPPAKPEITYISTFAEGRSDDEIMASNLKNQKIQDVLRAREAAREEMQKDLYRQLGKATGVDTDAIERDLAKEKAADEAKEKAKAKAAEARTVASQ